jgi:hypothetical protein
MRFHVRAAFAAVLGLAVFLPSGAALAQGRSPDEVWRELREGDVARNGRARQIVPERYRTFRLDRGRLAALLAAAPAEAARRAANSPLALTLPLPDGGYGTFTIVESPVMEAALAARYPQIRTYLGQGVEDPTATVRFDLTPKGFHAQIIGVDGTVYVDPFQPGDLDHYIAYRKRDHLDGERGVCHVTGQPVRPGKASPRKVSSGATLRTYRLAMAATGEYTDFHGGTVIDGLSAIATTLNRINGVYEREVSVRMVLIASNDEIIYTDGATDPYTNDDGLAMLSENQSNLDTVIGSANYDAGHVVSTGGGGIAALGSICTNSKAEGVTGSGAPLGDAFDVDYVAHEMGHQFAGNHTFNGSGVNCSGGNRNVSTAYEPGSGVSIQAYAGICGGDDLQPNSEDYFHRVSLNEIIAFTTTGAGASCGTTASTGNAVPNVSTTPAFTIPGRTPFTLTASGTDGDGDPLTYLWEQFDLGAANAEGVLSPTAATGPMFRSFTPSADPSRTFPSWRWILGNANVPPASAPLPGTGAPSWMTGEVLPNVSRTLNFRVTARDNRAGGGGTNEALAAIVVDNSAGPFAVTAPNTAVSLAAGAATTVSWNVAGTAAGLVSTPNVRITLSTNGGASFPIELLASTANDGSESVTLPAGTATAQARIRVQAVGNVFFDVSDVDFIITTGGNMPPTIAAAGSLSTRQGSPTASALVATVGDAEDLPGALSVAVSQAPPELAVSVQNVGGNVTLSATAACTLVAPTAGSKVYPLLLTVTDSGGASRSLSVNVEVASNRTPTLGAYAPINMVQNVVRTNVPAAVADDADLNMAGVSVSPTALPGGGTVAIAANGTVTVTTTAGTTLGSTTITARATDACGAQEAREFVLSVGAPQVLLVADSLQVVSGNALVEPNECNQFNLGLRNDGNTVATGVSAALSTNTGNVALTQAAAAFPDIPPGEVRASLTPYEVSTGAAASCFSTIALTASVTYGGAAGSPATVPATLPIGRPAATNYAFASSAGATLPNDGVLVAGSQSDNGMVTLTVPAGFSFQLYGTTYAGGTALRAAINGNLQFRASQGAEDAANLALPTPGGSPGGSPNDEFPAAAPTLFLQWDDWRTDFGAGGAAADAGIYTKLQGTAPNREWIIEWRGRIRADGLIANNNRAAIVLHENSSTFDYIYLLTGVGPSANAAGSTIGVQATATGPTFTQFAFENANIAPGTKLTATLAPALCAAGSGSCGATPAGVTIAQSGGTTNVTEGGATDGYTVVLNAAPSADVTITLSPDAQVATTPTPSLVFTTANWNTPQPVTVTAVNDAVAEGAHPGTITHSASGGGYTGLSIANVVANVTDNDSLGVNVAQSGGSTDVSEAGATDSYTLVLTSQPTADVTISLAPDAQVSVPASVTFTSANWSTPQPVTVAAVNDLLFEGAHTGTITHGASGGGYAGVAIANVVANVADDDPVPVDLAVSSRTLGVPTPGQRLTWEVVVDNLSAVGVASADFAFALPGSLTNVSWTCTAEAGATCPASGNGAPAHAIALAAGTGVLYLVGADVPAGTVVGTSLATTATVSVTTPYADSASANNSDTTADLVSGPRVFYNGFE